MNSSFTTHYIKDLATSPVPVVPAAPATQPTPKKQNLQSLVASLNQPLSHSETRNTLHTLELIECDKVTLSAAEDLEDREEYALKRAVIGKIVVGLYAEALNTYLAEAGEVEAEAEWWADIERSRQNVTYYFVQCECR
jgi:nuclear-control-of-ATPase protein 2